MNTFQCYAFIRPSVFLLPSSAMHEENWTMNIIYIYVPLRMNKRNEIKDINKIEYLNEGEKKRICIENMLNECVKKISKCIYGYLMLSTWNRWLRWLGNICSTYIFFCFLKLHFYSKINLIKKDYLFKREKSYMIDKKK